MQPYIPLTIALRCIHPKATPPPPAPLVGITHCLSAFLCCLCVIHSYYIPPYSGGSMYGSGRCEHTIMLLIHYFHVLIQTLHCRPLLSIAVV